MRLKFRLHTYIALENSKNMAISLWISFTHDNYFQPHGNKIVSSDETHSFPSHDPKFGVAAHWGIYLIQENMIRWIKALLTIEKALN